MKSRISIVEKPLTKAPKKCLVTGRADGRIVDFGTDCMVPGPEPHIYIKSEVVEEAAVLLDMVPKSDVEEMHQRLAEMESELQSLSAIAKPLQAIEEAETELKEAVDASLVA